RMASTMMRGIQRFSIAPAKVLPRSEQDVAPVLRFVACSDAQLRADRDLQACGGATPRDRFQRDVATVRAGDPAGERQAEANPAGAPGPAGIGAPEWRER